MEMANSISLMVKPSNEMKSTSQDPPSADFTTENVRSHRTSGD